MSYSLKCLPDVSRETLDNLCEFTVMFEQWADRINLVAPSTRSNLWERHVEDSAQLVSIKPKAVHWVDIGSGGGFPGIILAILLADNPQAQIALVESNRKKAAFLQSVRARLCPNAAIIAKRIEDALPILSAPEVLTARALAPVNSLLNMAHDWLGAGTVGLFHKGRGYEKELEESARFWVYDLIIHQSQIEVDSVILEISNLSPLGQGQK